ncbi:precorrin-6A/cobalt-precorrin-6A reductase [Oikeobacillus pervagus]|uniref:Precorrin-6A/cobalt-precorrin-6A reductase n=1 Tax=Oikeobacillus pervagus TaxID=1325931 RepID=A0AAJ1WFR0_9BACI|nr:precorrin-6A reductase [Oikeobacillus pervagus]MDQ0214232.1 precorrin-6A/cobalt-precorrin-6A reductase [Oikeobacillus pervagus]
MILFLAGTSDARSLAVQIKESGLKLLATVVTDNARVELEKVGIDTMVGRLNSDEMTDLIESEKIEAIVDASHPFAEEASKNAILAAKNANIPYIRYERPVIEQEYEKIIKASSYEEAAEIAAKKQGVIFLATGSKTLQIFSEILLSCPNTRMIARMLPRKDNMEKCEQLGIPQKNIVAIQGPFTKEFDQALYRQYGVTLLITKDSGKEGSVNEKVAAARELDIETILITRPKIEYENKCTTFKEVLEQLPLVLSK